MAVRTVICLAAAVTLAAGCGGEDAPELTLEQRLAAVEGRQLTAAEVTEKLDVGSALCGMDDAILDALWQRLGGDQLDFQDFVFGFLCPDRSVFYAGRTGRYVTEEAQNSGVVTSTTRPASTATAAGSPTVTATPTSSLGGATIGSESTVPGPADESVSTTPPSATSSASVQPPSTAEGEGG